MNKILEWQPCIDPKDYIHFQSALELLDVYIGSHINTKDSLKKIGIMDGFAGELLYCFYSAQYHENQTQYDNAVEKLEMLIEILDEKKTHSFCSGISGIIWLLIHLDKTGHVPGASNAIDNRLVDYICSKSLVEIEGGHYDYLHKGLGIVWAILSSEKTSLDNKDFLTEVVTALNNSAQRIGDQTYWLYHAPTDVYPDKAVSYGLSHGLASIVIILSKISQLQIAKETCDNLIESTINFILSQRGSSEDINLYPAVKGINDSGPNISRLGWCYGDPNIAIALHHGEKTLRNGKYHQEIKDILAHSVKRKTFGETSIMDGSICHGTCGAGHMFNRFYNLFQDESLKEAANYWHLKSFSKIRYTNEKMYIINTLDKKTEWTDDTSLLTGAAGLGLTILSGISSFRPEWDELLLLDL